MILCGYGYLTRPEIFDWVVSSAVAKFEFIGGATETVGQNLMSKTYSKDWNFPDELF